MSAEIFRQFSSARYGWGVGFAGVAQGSAARVIISIRRAHMSGDTYGRVRAVVTLDHATELVRHMLVLTILVAAPVLAVGLVVGLIISLLQAVTQVQEQTISLIPRMIAMAACLALLLPWMGQHVIEFARQILTDGVMR